MSESFLDTTILVRLVVSESDVALSEYLSSNLPARVPYYAVREFLTSLVRSTCDAHNKLSAAENPGEAILAFLSLPPVVGRKRDAGIRVVADEISKAFEKNPNGSRANLKRELLQALALKAVRLWKRARRPVLCSLVQSLGCFNSGEISRGEAGELRGPHDTFDCLPSERCAAAAYLCENRIVLDKLIAALHPSQLDDIAARKVENVSRRKALKEIRDAGATKFNKRHCRSIGDAYFAAMCPPGSTVVTTNIVDHKFLCEAVGKQAVEPPPKQSE